LRVAPRPLTDVLHGLVDIPAIDRVVEAVDDLARGQALGVYIAGGGGGGGPRRGRGERSPPRLGPKLVEVNAGLGNGL
jgi:hypothetical protein